MRAPRARAARSVQRLTAPSCDSQLLERPETAALYPADVIARAK